MLKHKLIYFPGLLVGGTDYYEDQTDIEEWMIRQGVEFRIAKRSAGVPMASRALCWKLWLESNLRKDEEFYILGYSDGGVSTRMMLTEFPSLAERCLVHISAASPHWGTPKAEKMAKLLGGLGWFNSEAKQIAEELTPLAMANFNIDNPNHKSIRYLSIITYIDKMIKTSWTNWYDYLTIKNSDGSNDGTVPTISQEWGQIVAYVQGDHKAAGSPHFRYGHKVIFKEVFAEALGALRVFEMNKYPDKSHPRDMELPQNGEDLQE